MYPADFPLVVNRMIYFVLFFVTRIKWESDRRNLPLVDHDWQLYLDIHIASALRLRRLPDLQNPVGYNDQVKWLMLFAQHELMPVCADKVRVREYVSERLGPKVLIPIRVIANSWSEIEDELTRGPAVLKCSHDSGSTTLLDSLDAKKIANLRQHYERQLSREHGVGKGEWHYKGIEPRLVLEERLPGSDPRVGPADIKVHCVNGQPRMVHIIDNRQADSRQAFFSAQGEPLSLSLKPHRGKINGFEFDKVKSIILPLVTKLAEPFRYVRVDFYLVEDKPFFGEMTFFEEAGLFPRRSEEIELASAIGIECVNPRPTLHNSLWKDASG